jgi:hypothetical protein
MITGAAGATINRLPVLLLPGDIFSTRRPAPVLQQLESSQSQDVPVNDCLRRFPAIGTDQLARNRSSPRSPKRCAWLRHLRRPALSHSAFRRTLQCGSVRLSVRALRAASVDNRPSSSDLACCRCGGGHPRRPKTDDRRRWRGDLQRGD